MTTKPDEATQVHQELVNYILTKIPSAKLYDHPTSKTSEESMKARHEASGEIVTGAKALCNKAFEVLKAKGHNQVLVYTPIDDERLHGRYTNLGFNRGGDYTCYWKDI